MWIVRLALRRPYTFVVLSILIALLGIGSAIETPKDIFPYINIPVVTIVWTYSGLPPAEMEGRIVTVCERALTTTVNDMEHTESESYQGISMSSRCIFQPQVQIAPGAGSGDVHCADHSARAASWKLVPSIHHQIRRFFGSNFAACVERARA